MSVRMVHKSQDGKWVHGATQKETGKIIYTGEALDGTTAIVFWQSVKGDTAEFEILGDASTLQVVNVWDCGNGVVELMHNCAAMIVDDLSNGRRYHCNDGFPDDDFDDIVFRLERVE